MGCYGDLAMTLLGRSWEELEADSRRMVAGAEERVVRWVWADGPAAWDRVEPYWAERRGLPTSRRAAAEPSGELGYLVRYGFDEQDRIRIARRVKGGTVDAPVRARDAVWLDVPDGRIAGLEYRHDRNGSMVLECLTAPFYDGNELREVLHLVGPGDCGPRGRERYERRDGRLVRIVEERWREGAWKPSWEFECGYVNDELASITTTRLDEPGGKPIVCYRRSSPRAVRIARKRVRDELPARVEQWVRRVAPDEPLFAVALLYSFEGPALPPALGLATERERCALLEATPHDRERIWNPAEWEILDGDAPELREDGLEACWQHLEQEWIQASDDRQPRALLVGVAKHLADAGLQGMSNPLHAVYAVDDELTDLDRNLRSTVSRAARMRLESAEAAARDDA
jgi:hypothetical protein